MFTVDASQTEYLIDNLEPDTPYNITVQAGTSRGFGPGASTRHSTDPFRLPIVVNPPILTPVGSDQLTAEWTGVSDPKDRIRGYILEFRRAEDPAWQEFEGIISHSNVKRTYLEHLRGLDPDTTYLVRVKVVDKSKRVGHPSKAAEAKTGCAGELFLEHLQE